MKLNYFYGSIAITQSNGYTNNLEFGTDKDSNELSFRYPYGNVTPERAKAVSDFVKTISNAFDRLEVQLMDANELLGEEQFAPKVLESSMNRTEETKINTESDTESEGT
jgi:hypothetical protein